jgi:hypothetical protein
MLRKQHLGPSCRQGDASLPPACQQVRADWTGVAGAGRNPEDGVGLHATFQPEFTVLSAWEA